MELQENKWISEEGVCVGFSLGRWWHQLWLGSVDVLHSSVASASRHRVRVTCLCPSLPSGNHFIFTWKRVFMGHKSVHHYMAFWGHKEVSEQRHSRLPVFSPVISLLKAKTPAG
jgi:hypothetical protein